MAELLENTHVSWKYYDGKPDPRQHSIWNPLPGFRQFQNNPGLMSHLVGMNQFYKDARNRKPAASLLDRAESRRPVNIPTRRFCARYVARHRFGQRHHAKQCLEQHCDHHHVG